MIKVRLWCRHEEPDASESVSSKKKKDKEEKKRRMNFGEGTRPHWSLALHVLAQCYPPLGAIAVKQMPC